MCGIRESWPLGLRAKNKLRSTDPPVTVALTPVSTPVRRSVVKQPYSRIDYNQNADVKIRSVNVYKTNYPVGFDKKSDVMLKL